LSNATYHNPTIETHNTHCLGARQGGAVGLELYLANFRRMPSITSAGPSDSSTRRVHRSVKPFPTSGRWKIIFAVVGVAKEIQQSKAQLAQTNLEPIMAHKLRSMSDFEFQKERMNE
jgi:hypothetical protein